MHSDNRIYKYISIFSYVYTYIYTHTYVYTHVYVYIYVCIYTYTYIVYIHITYLYVNFSSFVYHTAFHTYFARHTHSLSFAPFFMYMTQSGTNSRTDFFRFRIFFVFFFVLSHSPYHDDTIRRRNERCDDPLARATVYRNRISFHAECILKIFFCVFYFLSLLENNRSHTHTLIIFAHAHPHLFRSRQMSRLETIYPLFSFLFRPNGSSPVTVYRVMRSMLPFFSFSIFRLFIYIFLFPAQSTYCLRVSRLSGQAPPN